jgi:amidophosphoribosyltransferase
VLWWTIIVRGTTSREIVRARGSRRGVLRLRAPPVRYPNVYGIDMPTRAELIATGAPNRRSRPHRRRRRDLPDLDALIEDVRSLNPSIERFDCSCFDGVYVTGDVSQEYLEGIEMRRDGESNPETRLSSYQLDLGLSRVD